MTSPWVGFWQVVYDDRDDEIVPYPPLHTTMSLRRSGFSAYTDTHFIEVRTAAERAITLTEKLPRPEPKPS